MHFQSDSRAMLDLEKKHIHSFTHSESIKTLIIKGKNYVLKCLAPSSAKHGNSPFGPLNALNEFSYSMKYINFSLKV